MTAGCTAWTAFYRCTRIWEQSRLPLSDILRQTEALGVLSIRGIICMVSVLSQSIRKRAGSL